LKYLVAVALLAGATTQAQAQYTPLAPASRFINPPPPLKKDGQWRGLIGASLALTAGNSETNALLLNMDVARQTAHTKIAVQGFMNRASSRANDEVQTTSNKWGLATQYDSDLSNRWFAFGKLGFDGDRLIDLTLRTTVAAGVGYHLIDTNEQSLNVFGGASYIDRRYRADQVINDRTARHFSSPGAILGEESTHQLNERVSLKQRLEVYPDFSPDHAHLARFNGALNVSMSQKLSLSVGLLSTYNQQVPPGIKKTDTSLFTGINVKLGD